MTTTKEQREELRRLVFNAMVLGTSYAYERLANNLDAIAVRDLLNDIDTLEAERDRLRGALEMVLEYTRHDRGCPADSGGDYCKCGFDREIPNARAAVGQEAKP